MTQSAATQRIKLPFPISVNAMFIDGKKRRSISKRYEAWRSEAALVMMAQRARPTTERVNIWIDLVAPDRRHRDAGNFEKGVTDLLVAQGIIQGDDERYVKRVSIGWEDSGEPCVVTITAVEKGGAA